MTKPLIHKLASAAGTTNATLIKPSAGRIFKIRGYNASASVRYLKLFDSYATPVPGTSVPVVTFPLAPSGVFDIDFSSIGALGIYFPTGIGYSLTTGAADNDTAALTAADVTGLAIFYA